MDTIHTKQMTTKSIKFSLGVLEYSRNDKLVEFLCERCHSLKKSKTVVKWKLNDDTSKTICNGCYGNLLGNK